MIGSSGSSFQFTFLWALATFNIFSKYVSVSHGETAFRSKYLAAPMVLLGAVIYYHCMSNIDPFFRSQNFVVFFNDLRFTKTDMLRIHKENCDLGLSFWPSKSHTYKFFFNSMFRTLWPTQLLYIFNLLGAFWNLTIFFYFNVKFVFNCMFGTIWPRQM